LKSQISDLKSTAGSSRTAPSASTTLHVSPGAWRRVIPTKRSASLRETGPIAGSNGDGTFPILSRFRYFTSIGLRPSTIEVPIGFTTDFASIPKLFWNLLPPDGKYGRAAVVHDYLYSTEGLSGEFTREQCDRIFLEAMTDLGVGPITRLLMFRAVRWFGANHFRP
jgi:hypothetical protein